ncbi:hypothetical protein L5515_016291 [Caenorhabditis briggsae]|uniref:Uncharacterized protein n=1 Tax=Caenorhabditis briggsae TaxID=6238 RepID=A0AAE9FA78_CAEBR|nr:hypothetical protein L5515_016291 [Caenorhabditis briggsae]
MATKSQQQNSAASELSHWESTMVSQPWQRISNDVKLMEPCKEKIIPPIDLSQYKTSPFPYINSFDTFFKNITTDKQPRQPGDLNHNVGKTQSKSKFDIDSRSHFLKRRSSVSVIWESSSVESNKLINEPQQKNRSKLCDGIEKNVMVDKYYEKKARSSTSRIMDIPKTEKEFAQPLPPPKNRKHANEGDIPSKTKMNSGNKEPPSSELPNEQFLRKVQEQHPDFDFPQAIAQINWAVRQRNKGIALEDVLRSMVGTNVYSKVTSQVMPLLSKTNGMAERVSIDPPSLTCSTSASMPTMNSQSLIWKPNSQNSLPPFSGILPVLPESTVSNHHVTSPALPLLNPTNLQNNIPGQTALTIPPYTLTNSITDINQKCDLLKLLIAMNSAAPAGIPINQDVGNGGPENILTSALYNRNGETQDMVKQKLSYMRSKSLQHITLPQSILTPDQVKPLLVDMFPPFGISQPPINTSTTMTQLGMVLGTECTTTQLQ